MSHTSAPVRIGLAGYGMGGRFFHAPLLASRPVLVISSDDGLLSVGSGSPYALAAARAMMKHTALSAREVAEEALRIAADICIYTNDDIVVEEI